MADDTARGYNEEEIRTAEEQFDALMNAGITAAVAAMVAAILAEPIPAMISDATLQPLFLLWNTYTADVLIPDLTGIFLGSAQTLVDTAEPTLLALSYELTDIAPIDEPAAAWMSQATNRLRNVGNIVWEEIREQLTEGVKAGDGIPELAARVEQAAGFSSVRARLTARTEVAAASNGGAITQARALDLDMDKQWEATVPTDGRTRLTHIEAHHQTVPLGAMFEVGGSMLDFPGDPTGEASEVCNCRCAVTFVNIRRRVETAAAFRENQHRRDRAGKFARSSSRALPKLPTQPPLKVAPSGAIFSEGWQRKDDPEDRAKGFWQGRFHDQRKIREVFRNIAAGKPDPLEGVDLDRGFNYTYLRAEPPNCPEPCNERVFSKEDLRNDLISAAKWLHEALAGATETKRPLYRGIRMNRSELPQVGDSFDADLASWAEDRFWAEHYAGLPEDADLGRQGDTEVVFRLSGSKRSVPLGEQYLGEHLTQGKYKITKVTGTGRRRFVTVQEVGDDD